MLYDMFCCGLQDDSAVPSDKCSRVQILFLCLVDILILPSECCLPLIFEKDESMESRDVWSKSCADYCIRFYVVCTVSTKNVIIYFGCIMYW